MVGGTSAVADTGSSNLGVKVVIIGTKKKKGGGRGNSRR